jgi:hypothetical protein
MSPPHRVHDRAILDALELIGGVAFDARVWRVTRTGRPPVRGSTASGRWSPPSEFEVLYTSLEKDGALGEIGHRLSLEPVWPSRVHHDVSEIEIHLDRALRLDDLAVLSTLGIDPARYESYEYTATQALAAAANFLGFDGLLVPNARHASTNLVVLLENLDPGFSPTTLSSDPVDWAAWRNQRSRTRT